MGDIIKNWLIERLGIIQEIESEPFAHAVHNGYLIAQLLHSLELISDEDLAFAMGSGDSEDVLDHVETWLRKIGVELDAETKECLVRGKLSTAISFFHKLYRAFKGKDRVDFIITDKIEKLTLGRQINDRFKVTRVAQIFEDPIHPLSSPLLEYRHVIEWHKEKHKKLLRYCEKSRETYAKIDEKKEPSNSYGVFGEYYEEVVQFRDRAHCTTSRKLNRATSQYIVKKIRQKKVSVALMTRMEKNLLIKLWNINIEKHHRLLEAATLTQLLQQTYLEEQIFIALSETFEHANVIVQNRLNMNDEIKQQLEDEQMRRVFIKTVNRGDELDRRSFDKEKLKLLHKRLFFQKKELKKQMSRNLCLGIVTDLVNIAISEAEYFEIYEERIAAFNKSDLRALFVKSQAIFSVFSEPLIALVENNSETEEVYKFKRQDAIQEKYFEDYCGFYGSWKLEKHVPDFICKLDEIELALDILGDIVFRLISPKKPKSSSIEEEPSNDIAVCVNRIKNSAALTYLGELLAEKQIKLIQLEDAINNCLDAYKNERKTVQSLGKTEDEDQNASASDSKYQNKEVQVPPLADLSSKAELGRLIFETFYLGDVLSDELLAKIFAEYQRSLLDVRGWVLVNYPQNHKQAVLLEEVLTPPKSVDDEKFDDMERRIKCSCIHHEAICSIAEIIELKEKPSLQQSMLEDTKSTVFRSKLLRNPHVTDTHDPCLTKYVHIIEQKYESFHWNTDRRDLNNFYGKQGRLRNFDCAKLDLAAVNQLATLIIGYSKPVVKMSVQKDQREIIDGKSQIDMDDGEENSGATRENTKSDNTFAQDTRAAIKKKPRKNKTKKRIRLPPKETVRQENKETQIPEVEYVMQIRTIPNSFRVVLVTLWKSIEDTYVSDFKNAIFRDRILWNDIIPFIAFVKRHLRHFTTKPDKKQRYMLKLQRTYNAIDADLRNDDEFKAEMHARIQMFRKRLVHISKRSRTLAEEERVKIIEEDWVTKFLVEITNGSVMMLQIELDRTTNTLQFLNDYYAALVFGKPLCDKVFKKKCLSGIALDSSYEFKNIKLYSNFVQDILTYESKYKTSPFEIFLNDSYNLAIEAITEWATKSLNLLNRIEKLLQPKPKQKREKRSQPKSKRKKDVKSKRTLPELLLDKEIALHLVEEGRCVINGEVLRINLRLNLIQSVFTKRLNFIVDYAKKAFHELGTEIIQNYKDALDCIYNACEVLTRAVEEEVPLQEELVLKANKFYINRNVLLFEDSLPEIEHPKDEKARGKVFTTKQLSDLVDIFLAISPNGLLPERAFVFTLQDVVAGSTTWQEVSTSKLSRNLFGKVQFVDWKDFVIYNLLVKFPTEEELLAVRSQFLEHDPDLNEFVYEYQFNAVKFWFEKCNQDKNRVKQLLFKMYGSTEDTVNYTALLLDFCKDEDFVVGIAKALELSLGRHVCWKKGSGEKFKSRVKREEILQRIQLTTAEKIESRGDMIERICGCDIMHEDMIYWIHPCFEREGLTNIQNDLVDRLNGIAESADSIYWRNCNYEDRKYGGHLLLEDTFSDDEIGFMKNYGPPKAYYLPFELLLNVLMASMPWKFWVHGDGDLSFSEQLTNAYESCRNAEFYDLVLMHEFLNSASFKNLLKNTSKFVTKNAVKIVNDLIKYSKKYSRGFIYHK